MARKGFVSRDGTVTDADASTAAEKAKAVEIKKQLERLVKAIVDEDDYRVEIADEVIRTLASSKDLKSQKLPSLYPSFSSPPLPLLLPRRSIHHHHLRDPYLLMGSWVS
ncbi:U-box domain-containing protein 9-like [Pyrus ussuriensis x Pyrus communis]|uniref:U-box domain-containing protein 9-like n=1 Tax=Pyrus ussuriensis x Pyrus communis TaxID=2448454 RepID=A0A5N5HBR1_9ROSA|nr:U-box domain-containing protein 9-like [Pyrus ussuriensis x Pyrus communis]